MARSVPPSGHIWSPVFRLALGAPPERTAASSAQSGVQLPYVVLAALLYFAASKVGHLLAVPPSQVTPLWPPSGVALLSLVLLGRRYWTGVLAGALVAQTVSFFEMSAPLHSAAMCSAIAVGSTLQAYVGAWLLERWIGRRSPYGRVSDVIRFVSIAYLGCMISASIGVVALHLGAGLPWGALLVTWDTWWLGDALGVLIIYPIPFVWWQVRRSTFTLRKTGEWGLFFAGLTAVSLVVFTDLTPLGLSDRPLSALLIPFVVWGAHAGGLVAMAGLSLVLAAVAVGGTVTGYGPFVRPTLHESILMVQLHLGVVIGMGYALVAGNTQHTRAEAAAWASESRARTIIRAVPDLLAVLDGSGRLLERLSGKAPLKGPFGVVHDLSEGPTLHEIREVVQSVISHRQLREVEYEVITDGESRWWWARVVPVEQVGLERVLWAARDITAQKALEGEMRQKQKMAVIGQLAGGIAHDFNNLLTVINGTAELLVETTDDPDCVDELRRIHTAGLRAASLTGQLMTFSRKAVVRPTVVRVDEVLRLLEDLLRRTIGTGVSLSLELAPDLHGVHADTSQVEQVLLNLIINARDAVDQSGHITVRAWNAPAADGLGSVVVEVKDDGHGMSQAVKEHIFEPFFTTRDVGQGTGLGLSTVYGIVERWRGTIEVESSPGEGATFRVRWPAVPHEHLPRISTLPTATAGNGQTILVVDDQASVLGLAARMVQQLGFKVISTTSGAEAIRIASDRSVTLHGLLTDVMLPHLNGPAVAEQFRISRPDLPVVFMSGYTDDALDSSEPFDDALFVQKPFTFSQLASVLSRAMA